jgi:hypothetical protein
MRSASRSGDPFRHGAEHLPVVDLLERLPVAHAATDLPDQQDQRRRVLVGRVHAARRVGGARPTRDHADPRAAGQLAVGVGHVGGADLVPADHVPDGRVVQRVEHREVALARHAEGQLDAVDGELVDEDAAARAGQGIT